MKTGCNCQRAHCYAYPHPSGVCRVCKKPVNYNQPWSGHPSHANRSYLRKTVLNRPIGPWDKKWGKRP